MAEQTQIPAQTPAKPLVIGDSFNPPIHTDGFYSIRMLGDSVRITFFSYMAAADEQPKPVLTGSLVMSLPAFLKSAECVEDYIKNLEKAGVVKKT